MIIKEMRYYQTYLLNSHYLIVNFSKSLKINVPFPSSCNLKNLLTESNLILATDINLGWKLDLSMLTVSRT